MTRALRGARAAGAALLALALGLPRAGAGAEGLAEPGKGMIAGASGEFFRYKHMFNRRPTDADRDEDDLADALEGDPGYEPTGDMVTDRMLSHKKGCNKHFKDELIAEGYRVRPCRDAAEGEPSEPCLHKEDRRPNEMSSETYEIWKEGLFYACEQTVGLLGSGTRPRPRRRRQPHGSGARRLRARCPLRQRGPPLGAAAAAQEAANGRVLLEPHLAGDSRPPAPTVPRKIKPLIQGVKFWDAPQEGSSDAPLLRTDSPCPTFPSWA
ncbi:unnamed protein product, partial [Prorocentrum cordatum]